MHRATWPAGISFVEPMLATLADAPLVATTWAYERKYDGVRAIVQVAPGGRPDVTVWSRAGRNKTAQFPNVVEALSAWARRLDRPLLLDGEIVAIHDEGHPIGFQHLQERLHRARPGPAAESEAAFIAFDLLRDGDEDLRPRPLRERRLRLERCLADAGHRHLRLSEQAVGDGRALHARAVEAGWEGLVAKRVDAPYASGRRSPDWRKLKLLQRLNAVVAGWTDPRGSRPYFGSLILGQYDPSGHLVHIGYAGTGFTDRELERVWARLQPLTTTTCPFPPPLPKPQERPHWVTPALVAEVAFMEWTHDRKLRHPIYLALRDNAPSPPARPAPDALATGARGRGRRAAAAAAAHMAIIDRLEHIEAEGGDGTLDLPNGGRLDVTHLGKVLWPSLGLTKGDLLRHYARVAPVILPVLADRPLVMKRYPNGIEAAPFYQHRAPSRVPSGVRIAEVETGTDRRAHLIGGDLLTLLYTAQLASISQDPWISRAGSEQDIDYVTFDLDPPEGLPFARVRDVALAVRDALDGIGATGFPKTSGAGGMHVYVRTPPHTPYEAGLLFSQILATVVASRHPKLATVERSIAARGRRVYVDYLQNARGKTLASAYSLRANDFAGVSAPLSWSEVESGVSPEDFTLRSFPARLSAAGDLWEGLRRSKPANLRALAALATRPGVVKLDP